MLALFFAASLGPAASTLPELRLLQELQEELAAGGVSASCEHDGHQYAVYVPALEAAWQSGRIPLMEGPLALSTAMKSGLDGVDVVCVYLSADVEQLDVRMRRADMVGEAMLQHQLALAQQEALMQLEVAEAAAAAAAAAAPPLRRNSSTGRALPPVALPPKRCTVDHVIDAGLCVSVAWCGDACMSNM